MKFIVIALAIIGTTEALKCHTGDGTKAASDCTGEDDKCSGPTFTEYTGLAAGVTYGCGDCKGTTKADGKCAECKTDACNAPKATAADFTCHSYTVEENKDGVVSITKGAATTCKRLAATSIACNMPTPTSKKTTYTSVSGCGPCKKGEKSGSTCAECTTDSCNVMAEIKCVQGDGSAAAAACPLTATKCYMPKFVGFTGFASGVKYGCGECPKGTTAETCETCDEKAADGCNKKKETGADFECNNWSFDDATKKFKPAETKTTCKRLKETKIACNMPSDSATKEKYTSKSTCGPCEKGEKDKGCKECDKALCNKAAEKEGEKKEDTKKDGATSVTALLLPLLAMVYTLF